MAIVRGEISLRIRYLKKYLVERSLALNSKSSSFCPPLTHLGVIWPYYHINSTSSTSLRNIMLSLS